MGNVYFQYPSEHFSHSLQLVKSLSHIDGRKTFEFKLIRSPLEPDTIIRTDGIAIYNPLAEEYTHIPTVSKGKPKDAALPWVHTVISNAKEFIDVTFHGLDKKHLQRYLDEFCYRFNRHKENELFERLLIACIEAPPKTYDELTE